MPIHAREGDFVETIEGLIFDVKGLIHPKKYVIAFLRYIPDPMGNRMHNGVRYRKIYALEKRFDYLNCNYPEYVYTDSVINTTAQAIPHDRIKKIYYPHDYLESLSHKKRNRIENDLIEFVDYLTEYSKVLILDIGISGSHMVGLNLSHSDFDIVVYGKENCYKVYNCMDRLFKNWDLPFRRYGIEDLRELYDFRGKETGIDFGNFYHFESRKSLQGKFKNVDFYIRCIKAWDEINSQYGYFRYKTMGKSVIQAYITNDEESIFTPCKYDIEDVKFLQGTRVDDLDEVVSFRGRCCEARKNESMLARGNLESVSGRNGETYHRLIVGGDKTDFLYT
jgi:predicted nucleotidyltransferase